MKKASGIRGAVALALGVIGSLMAIAALVVSILFIVRANDAVDGVEERVTRPIDRLDRQIEQTSAAVSDAAEGELDTRLASIADQASTAESALDAIEEHPLYSNVPVDLGELEDRLRSVAERAGELEEVQVDAGSDVDRSRISESLTELAEPLDGIEGLVEKMADSLRFWIRVSGLAFVLLSLWGLWAQLALARHGRSTRSKGREADES